MTDAVPANMKCIDIDRLQPGDIILTASKSATGKLVRLASKGDVSHAMICVQHGSIIDSTSEGVQARNLQREFFSDDEQVSAFRLREALPPLEIQKVVDFARSEIGTRYSKIEAARSVAPIGKPRGRRQFCSRLVARAYASVGIRLVADQDYCTPEELRKSGLLQELDDISVPVSAEEVAAMSKRSNPLQLMREAQNEILAFVRSLDPEVENFTDVDRVVRDHPEWDAAIADAYRKSGYLDLWGHELSAHPYRYDLALMEEVAELRLLADMRAYCVGTIREYYSGGVRFSANLAHYEASQQESPRETVGLLIDLYQTLVRDHERRVETARQWLAKHFPEDVDQHLERIVPHTPLWFSIVDRVEPRLGAIARMSISSEQSVEVCSSCGDPANDYRIANAAEAMPGVPALRLCDDCVVIRRGFGEILEAMD